MEIAKTSDPDERSGGGNHLCSEFPDRFHVLLTLAITSSNPRADEASPADEARQTSRRGRANGAFARSARSPAAWAAFNFLDATRSALRARTIDSPASRGLVFVSCTPLDFVEVALCPLQAVWNSPVLSPSVCALATYALFQRSRSSRTAARVDGSAPHEPRVDPGPAPSLLRGITVRITPSTPRTSARAAALGALTSVAVMPAYCFVSILSSRSGDYLRVVPPIPSTARSRLSIAEQGRQSATRSAAPSVICYRNRLFNRLGSSLLIVSEVVSGHRSRGVGHQSIANDVYPRGLIRKGLVQHAEDLAHIAARTVLVAWPCVETRWRRPPRQPRFRLLMYGRVPDGGHLTAGRNRFSAGGSSAQARASACLRRVPITLPRDVHDVQTGLDRPILPDGADRHGKILDRRPRSSPYLTIALPSFVPRNSDRLRPRGTR